MGKRNEMSKKVKFLGVFITADCDEDAYLPVIRSNLGKYIQRSLRVRIRITQHELSVKERGLIRWKTDSVPLKLLCMAHRCVEIPELVCFVIQVDDGRFKVMAFLCKKIEDAYALVDFTQKAKILLDDFYQRSAYRGGVVSEPGTAFSDSGAAFSTSSRSYSSNSDDSASRLNRLLAAGTDRRRCDDYSIQDLESGLRAQHDGRMSESDFQSYRSSPRSSSYYGMREEGEEDARYGGPPYGSNIKSTSDRARPPARSSSGCSSIEDSQIRRHYSMSDLAPELRESEFGNVNIEYDEPSRYETRTGGQVTFTRPVATNRYQRSLQRTAGRPSVTPTREQQHNWSSGDGSARIVTRGNHSERLRMNDDLSIPTGVDSIDSEQYGLKMRDNDAQINNYSQVTGQWNDRREAVDNELLYTSLRPRVRYSQYSNSSPVPVSSYNSWSYRTDLCGDRVKQAPASAGTLNTSSRYKVDASRRIHNPHLDVSGSAYATMRSSQTPHSHGSSASSPASGYWMKTGSRDATGVSTSLSSSGGHLWHADVHEDMNTLRLKR